MRDRAKLRSGKLAVGFPSKRDEAVLDAMGSRMESVLYDFTQDTGAVATLSFGRHLPAGAIVTGVHSDEITVLTSGGSATLQLKAGATALTDALAFDTGFLSAQTQALASSATAIKLAADSELKLTIAAAALTAGKVRFYVRYLIANDGHA